MELKYLFNMFNKLIFLFFLLYMSDSWSIGLGNLEIHSSLNQPLIAYINLLHTDNIKPEKIIPMLGSKKDFQRIKLQRPKYLKNLKFKIIQDESGLRILVFSQVVMKEPLISFLLEVRVSNERRLREYTILLDPPEAKPKDFSLPSKPEKSIAEEKNYMLQSTDTLFKVAQRFLPDKSITIEQMIIALQKINPDAFNNQGELQNLQEIKIPTKQQVLQLSAEFTENKKSEISTDDQALENDELTKLTEENVKLADQIRDLESRITELQQNEQQEISVDKSANLQTNKSINHQTNNLNLENKKKSIIIEKKIEKPLKVTANDQQATNKKNHEQKPANENLPLKTRKKPSIDDQLSTDNWLSILGTGKSLEDYVREVLYEMLLIAVGLCLLLIIFLYYRKKKKLREKLEMEEFLAEEQLEQASHDKNEKIVANEQKTENLPQDIIENSVDDNITQNEVKKNEDLELSLEMNDNALLNVGDIHEDSITEKVADKIDEQEVLDFANEDIVQPVTKELDIADRIDDLDKEIDYLTNDDDNNVIDVTSLLDLSRAYIEMEDMEEAINILNKVKKEGNEEQQQEAEALLQRCK